MSENQKDADEKAPVVITPGGPRSKDSVHMVSPDSVVSFEEEKPAETRQPVRESNSSITGNLVLTPGGYRDRSQVRLVKPGHTVTVEKELRAVERVNRMERTTPDVSVPPAPLDEANWISAVWWQNTTGEIITSFRTTWQVPPAPARQAQQLLYIFNGIQPEESASVQTILQPVLQWGGRGADEDGVTRVGNFWTVASWIVPDAQGIVHHTPHVRVNPGDILVGNMTLTAQSGGVFTYTCEFEGIPATRFSVDNMPELTWCIEVLEVYELDSTVAPPYDLHTASEYPDTERIAFREVNIRTGNGNPSGNWLIEDYITTFGEHSVLVPDSPVNGEIDIYFR